MGYGLAALAGLGRGSGGLLEGMMAGDKLALEQQQLAQQQQYQQGHLDLLRQQLMMPLIQQQQKDAAAQDLAQRLERAVRPGPPTMTPGAALEMPQPGALMKPPVAGPAAPLSQPESPMAPLHRMIPILARYAPNEAIKATMELATQPTPPPGFVPQSYEHKGIKYGPEPGPLPPGLEPSEAVGPGGVKYARPQIQPTKEITANDVAKAEDDYRANPTPETKAAMDRAHNAFRLLLSERHAGAPKVGVEFKPPDTAQTERNTQLRASLVRVQRLGQMARQLEENPGVLNHFLQILGPTLEDRTHIAMLSPWEREFLTLYDIAQPAYMTALQGSTLGRNPKAYAKAERAFGEPFGVGFADRMHMAEQVLRDEIQAMQGSMGEAGKTPFTSPSTTPPVPTGASRETPPARKFVQNLFNPQGQVTNPGALNQKRIQAPNPPPPGGWVEGKPYRGSDGNIYRYQGGWLVAQ